MCSVLLTLSLFFSTYVHSEGGRTSKPMQPRNWYYYPTAPPEKSKPGEGVFEASVFSDCPGHVNKSCRLGYLRDNNTGCPPCCICLTSHGDGWNTGPGICVKIN
nr:uncharacterized protein LOC119172725 [Rhipicephalus microplus]